MVAELDGKPATPDQLRALALVNYGHFTTMLAVGSRVRGLSCHLDRLVRDCQQVFSAELDPDRVRTLVRQALTGWSDPVVVRVTVFDPGLDLSRCGTPVTPHLLVTVRPAPSSPPPPLRLSSACYRRDLPHVKHVGLFGSVLHRRAAQRAGFDDVLFTAPDGAMIETATANIGFVTADGRVILAAGDALPGITAGLLARACGGLVDVAAVRLSDLPMICGSFITNAVLGIAPVSEIDSFTWSADHPVLGVLRNAYDSLELEPFCP